MFKYRARDYAVTKGFIFLHAQFCNESTKFQHDISTTKEWLKTMISPMLIEFFKFIVKLIVKNYTEMLELSSGTL